MHIAPADARRLLELKQSATNEAYRATNCGSSISTIHRPSVPAPSINKGTKQCTGTAGLFCYHPHIVPPAPPCILGAGATLGAGARCALVA